MRRQKRRRRRNARGRKFATREAARFKEQAWCLKEQNLAAVYALLDPVSGCPRYVGVTTRLYARWGEHVLRKSFGTASTPLDLWKKALYQQGKRPVLVVLETTSKRTARRKERRWVIRLAKRGYDLLNQHLQKQYHNTHDGICTIFGAGQHPINRLHQTRRGPGHEK